MPGVPSILYIDAALDRTYVVILSGSVLSASNLIEMEAAGVRDTLQKPVLRSDLVRVLEAAQFPAESRIFYKNVRNGPHARYLNLKTAMPTSVDRTSNNR